MPLVKNEAQNKFPEVANYSALPAPNTVPGQTYAVLNEQGTSWLPGSMGGTYYDRGLYYSSGIDWIYTNHPFNASQATVDAGLNNNQFLTPLTFTNSAQLAAKQNSLLGTGIVRSVGGVISYIDGPATSFVKADGSLDTNTYLTGNQNITLTGDVTGSGTTAIVTTLATVNGNVGSFGSATQVPVFTVNGKGLITAVVNTTITPDAASITGGQALTKTDDTNVTLTLGGTPGSSLLQAVSLTLGWTGQLSVSRGGTGLSTVASGSIIVANSLDTFTAITSVAGNKGLINDAGVISWETVTGTGAPVRETSPALLGNPTAPTQNLYDNSTKIATTAYVDSGRPYDSAGYRKTGTDTYERWYTNALNCSAGTTASLAQNISRYYPFIVPKECTIDRIGIDISGAGAVGSVVKLGIYDSVNSVPTNLVIDAGTVNGNSATFQAITINQVLTPGLYFMYSNHNSATNITIRAIGLGASPIVLGYPNTGGITPATGLFVTESYVGTLPSSPTGVFGFITTTPICHYVRLSA